MANLHLPLKGEYFDQIKIGVKVEEYRLETPYWNKRLVGRAYDQVILTRGYPKRGDPERTLVRPWMGYKLRCIQHPHFGPEFVTVFAISVASNPQPDASTPRSGEV